jgi:hypothetical protein
VAKAKPKARPIVLAVVSDVHAGSTVAPAPSEGVRYADGGRYEPSKSQLWLWERWNEYWIEVARIRQQHDASLGILVNGDCCDGPGHHGTHQSVAPNSYEEQSYIIRRVFEVPQQLASPDWWVLTQGTRAHVGDAESALARSLNAIKDPVTDSWVWYRWTADLHGVHIDATHHGRTGGRPWTMASAAGILASEIMMEHAQAGVRWPDLAIRSHKHTPADSGDMHPVRVLATPAWQLMTDFGYKVVPEKSVNAVVGGYIVVIQPDGTYDVLKKLYRVLPPKPWRP